MIEFIDYTQLAFLIVIVVAVAALRNLFAAVMLFGIYSLVAAALFVILDAVDVAFTEAAVGAGIATLLMLATLAVTGLRHEAGTPRSIIGLATVVAVAGLLLFGTSDMPGVGDPNAPANEHVAPYYLTESASQIGVPNVVTSVLASYRGYDTLGEVTVIFTAGIAVLCLLGRRRRRDESG